MIQFRFTTDTATMCVFDPKRLAHRLSDDADWWCWPPEERLRELQARNVVFLDIGSDGTYFGEVAASELIEPVVEVSLEVASGRIFIGAAEEVTSEGMEPECARGGIFMDLKPGTYLMQANKADNGRITLHFRQQSSTEVTVPDSLPESL